jgi:hypothetical protein
MTFGNCGYMDMAAVLKIDLIGRLDRIIYHLLFVCKASGYFAMSWSSYNFIKLDIRTLLFIYGNLFVTDEDVSHLPFTHRIDVSQLSFEHVPFVQTPFIHIEDWPWPSVWFCMLVTIWAFAWCCWWWSIAISNIANTKVAINMNAW